MRRTTRVGLFCACIGLLAPRVFADAILLEGKTFSSQSEVFLIEVEQGQNAEDSNGFAIELCAHCKVKADGPFLFNPNLSQAAFSRDFFAPFSGVSSLSPAAEATPMPPTALLSSSINAIATQSTAAPATSTTASSSTGSQSSSTGTSTSTSTSTTTTVGGTTMPTSQTKAADPFAANPEPATVFLLGTGLAAGVIGRRKLRGRNA